MNSNRLPTAAALISFAAGAVLAHPISQHAAQQPESRVNDGSDLQDRRSGPMEVVDLPEPAVSIRIEGQYRVIRTNSLPNHPIGQFPNPGNPNAPRSVDRVHTIPLNPSPADRPTPANPEFGVALNGVIFDAGTGEFWTASGERGHSAWNYDAAGPDSQARFGTDFNHGHVQPTGKYHYHGVPTALVEALAQAQDHDHDHEHADADHAHHDDGDAHRMIQIGWAFDGFPIYAPFGYEDPSDPTSDIVELTPSYRLKQGNRPGTPEGPGGPYDGTYTADYEYVEGLGDLDASNGRTGVTPEFPAGTYYYVITDAYPSVPRTWVGTPGPSVNRRPPNAGAPGSTPPAAGDNARPPRSQPSSGPQTSAIQPAAQPTAQPITRPVNPAFFIQESLAAPIVQEERTLSDGSTALCYVIQTYSEPAEHAMGPWAPTHIDDGPEKGGIWFRDGKVYDVDGPFVRNIAEFYNDPEWKLYREDGSIKVTDTKEAFEAAARPDVDPKYNNHVVEGRPEWIDRNVVTYVIPVQPVYRAQPTLLGRPGARPQGGPQGGPEGRPEGAPERGARPDAPPPGRRPGGDNPGDRPTDAQPMNVLGVAFNGVNFEPPAPVDAILAAHTLAPFDDAGGHINPHNGYHYHAATGHTKEIAQPDDHAPMIGYILDGFALYAHTNKDGSVPTDLDECAGHSDPLRGYHYHAGAPGDNQIIKGFRGIPGTMTTHP